MKYLCIISLLGFISLNAESFVVKAIKKKKNIVSQEECANCIGYAIKMSADLIEQVNIFQKKMIEDMEYLAKNGKVCSWQALENTKKCVEIMHNCAQELLLQGSHKNRDEQI